MDLNTKLILKVQLSDEIRKMPIHNEDITYDELIIMMERVFKHKLNADDEIIIKYKDEDNDLITISDDSDLAFAIENSNILKLCLTVENQNSKEELLTQQINTLNSKEINNIRKELKMIRDICTGLLDKLVDGINNDINVNQIAISSIANTVTDGKELLVVGGKEFDPLSVSNQSKCPVEPTGTPDSLVSYNQENLTLSNCENTDHAKQTIQEQVNSTVNVGMKQSSMGMYNNFTGQIQPQSSMSNSSSVMSMGSANAPPSIPPSGPQNIPCNIGNQNLVQNIQGQNLPHNLGSHNSRPNIGVHNMPPTLTGHHMIPNMGNVNMPPVMGAPILPPVMGTPNMPDTMGNQNAQSNIVGGSNMQHMSESSNLPFKGMENSNSPLSNNPTFPGNYPNFSNAQSVNPGQIQPQKGFYPGILQSPRISSPNFQGITNPVNPNIQVRPPTTYFNPQNVNSQFNPNLSNQNNPYGYPHLQK